MANLDPFVIEWPQKWIEDPEIAPVINYLNLFLHNLFFVIDGGNAVEDVEVNNASIRSRLVSLMQSIDELNMRNNNRSEIAALSKRISDLEMQQ